MGITCIGKEMAILRQWRVRLGCCVYLRHRAVLATLVLLPLGIPKLLGPQDIPIMQLDTILTQS